MQFTTSANSELEEGVKMKGKEGGGKEGEDGEKGEMGLKRRHRKFIFH